MLVPEGVEGGAVQLVGAGLRDGVEEEATEVALPHVERREEDLELLDRLDGERLGAHFGARGSGGAETEDVTLGGAVDLHVVHAVGHAARRRARARGGDLGGDLHEVGDVARRRRSAQEDGVGDGRPRARVRRAELTGVDAGDLDGGQRRDLGRQVEVEHQGLGERHFLIVQRLRLQADAARRDGVSTADLEVLDAIAAILTSLRSHGEAGGAIADDDLHGGERLSRVVRHLAGDGAGGDALGGEPARENGDEGDSGAQHPTRDSHNVCASGLKSGAINGAVDSAIDDAEPIGGMLIGETHRNPAEW